MAVQKEQIIVEASSKGFDKVEKDIQDLNKAIASIA